MTRKAPCQIVVLDGAGPHVRNVAAGRRYCRTFSFCVFSRLDVKLLRTLVANHSGLFATFAADALFGCASNDLFGPRQLGWQLLPTRMLACGFKRQLQLFPLTLGLYFGSANSRL